MDAEPLDIDHLLTELTLEEKAKLCSGKGFWHTQAIERLGIPSVMVSDGPHGLRVQTEGGDHLGIDSSDPATCFPPAVTLASTWNPETVRGVGRAIGAEARAAGLAVVLGPGVNIKRSPLCGRNFEYFSEDPHVAAVMGTAWVDGIQATGVGASLKHFAANNQETDRLRVSADIDERALREIYLAAFEPVIRDAQPWTVMCSYNRINGTYASQDPWLLTEVLRDEWGFEGLVVSDWGAVDDPVASVAAGLDLEMPSTGPASPAALVAAVQAGTLAEADLDRAVRVVLELVNRATVAACGPAPGFDVGIQHAVAGAAAAEGAVLLKNEGGVLPLRPAPGARVVVVGEMARTPRYQGAGSSQVNPTRVDDALSALRAEWGDGVTVDFTPGYSLDADATTDAHDAARAEALDRVQGADAVVVFAGLPGPYESEGFDRTGLDLPAEQITLIEAIAGTRPDTIVVLANGGVVTTGAFDSSVAAILECWLGGQASGSAVAALLTGAENPSGKLTETIPHRLEDTSAFDNFPGEERHVRYGEGIFVGYRRYDTADVPVAYPFGHGLSYTTFAYSDLTVDVLDGEGSLEDPVVAVTATITNTGTCDGAEVVQVYVSAPTDRAPRPRHELRGFAKVDLGAGDSDRVRVTLSRRDLARWSTATHGWAFDPGTYRVEVAASSRDVRLAASVEIPGDVPAPPLDDYSSLAEWLAHPVGHDLLVTTLESGPAKDMAPLLADASLIKVIGQFPLRRLLPMLGGLFTADDLRALVDHVNSEHP